MAVDIDEALNDLVFDVGQTAEAGTSIPRMENWVAQMFEDPSQFPPPGIPWNRDNLDQRSVYDWLVPTLEALDAMRVIGEGQESGNIAILVLRKTLLAVKFGTINLRVTANQETSVVTIYTNVWE